MSTKRKMLDINVIIPIHNGTKITLNCLKGLLTTDVRKIIIIDNNSSDNTVKKIKTLKNKRIKIIQNNTNKGYAEANNQGFYQAKSKYILFLNNDTIVKKGFLNPLINTLEKNKKIAAVQPLILFPDKTIDSVGSYLTPTGFLYHRAHRQKPSQKNSYESEVYSLKGACMLWKKEVLDKIGVFSKDYFSYFEETDLCHRAINAGYKLIFTPKSQIIHLGGFTSNKMKSDIIQYFSYRNRIKTYLKNLPFSHLAKILPVHIFLCQLLVFKNLIFEPKLAFTIQKAIWVGLIKGSILRIKQGQTKKTIKNLIRKPDYQYYLALFNSLEGYHKLW